MFFTYDQNNTGGYYTGQYRYIIVEAKSAETANLRAELSTPIYFDGVQLHGDCECCGNRWDRQYDDANGYSEPTIYGRPVELEDGDPSKADVLIVYEDGYEAQTFYERTRF